MVVPWSWQWWTKKLCRLLHKLLYMYPRTCTATYVIESTMLLSSTDHSQAWAWSELRTSFSIVVLERPCTVECHQRSLRNYMRNMEISMTCWHDVLILVATSNQPGSSVNHEVLPGADWRRAKQHYRSQCYLQQMHAQQSAWHVLEQTIKLITATVVDRSSCVHCQRCSSWMTTEFPNSSTLSAVDTGQAAKCIAVYCYMYHRYHVQYLLTVV